MTLLSRLLVFFPALALALDVLALAAFATLPGWQSALVLVATAYGFPLACYRLLELFHPLREGLSRLSDRRFSPWWGGHRIQLVFTALPQLEALLRIIPGAYSAWLRLWGSHIGRGVYWTPRVEIEDRALLDVGDGSVIGHKVEFYAHAIKPKRATIVLYVRRITIGAGAFVSGGTRLGPGAIVPPGAFVPLLTDVYVNQTYTPGEKPEGAHM